MGVALVTLAVVSQRPLLRLGLTALLGTAPGLEVLPEGADQQQAQVLLLDSALPDLEALLEQGRSASFRALVVAPVDDAAEAERLLHRGARGYVPLTSPLPELVKCVLEVARGEVGLPARLNKLLLSRMAGADLKAPLEPLSEREHEILGLLCQGRSNKAIAQKLYLSVRTVEGHLANLYAKLGVNSRTQAALAGLALRPGEAAPR